MAGRVFNPGAPAPRAADAGSLARIEAKVDALMQTVNALLSALDADTAQDIGAAEDAQQWPERDPTESLD